MSIRIIACLMLLIAGSTPGFAAEPQLAFPTVFESGGTLESINKEKLLLTVNDVQVRLSSATRVHTMRQRNQYLGALKVGQTIGIHYSNPGDSSPIARDIWILEGPQQLIPLPSRR